MSKSKTSSQETSPSLPPQAESCSWAQTPQAAVLPTTAAPIWGTHSRFLPRRTTAQEGRLRKARFPPSLYVGDGHLETLHVPRSECHPRNPEQAKAAASPPERQREFSSAHVRDAHVRDARCFGVFSTSWASYVTNRCHRYQCQKTEERTEWYKCSRWRMPTGDRRAATK